MSPHAREHETYIEKTIEMAKTAAERGDRPCGSLLVSDGEIIASDTNRVYTDNDLALHPELSLARWADRELTSEQRAEVILYTTIEPCSMCATAIGLTGLGAVVFCVSGDNYWELAAAAGHEVPADYIPCREVLNRMDAETTVTGSVKESDGVDVVRAVL